MYTKETKKGIIEIIRQITGRVWTVKNEDKY